MTKTTITTLPDRHGFSPDPLKDILRAGARDLIQQAVEAELSALMDAHTDERTKDGRARLIRHGHLPEGEVIAGVGYAACDPENRLITATLEKRWEEALSRVQNFEDRMAGSPDAHETLDPSVLNGLAQDLKAAWDAPTVSMRVRQQLLRTLIEDIVADVDDTTPEIVLVVHWKGGRHTEFWVK